MWVTLLWLLFWLLVDWCLCLLRHVFLCVCWGGMCNNDTHDGTSGTRRLPCKVLFLLLRIKSKTKIGRADRQGSSRRPLGKVFAKTWPNLAWQGPWNRSWALFGSPLPSTSGVVWTRPESDDDLGSGFYMAQRLRGRKWTMVASLSGCSLPQRILWGRSRQEWDIACRSSGCYFPQQEKPQNSRQLRVTCTLYTYCEY